MIDINNLDLSAVTESGPRRLPSGAFRCVISGMEVKQTNTANGAGTYMIVSLDGGSEGSISANICLDFNGPNKEKAETTKRIGLETLKKLLVVSGHPSPDKPGNLIQALKGKVVGVKCDPDFYVKDGEVRSSSKIAGYFKVEEGMVFGPDGRVHPKAAGGVSAKPATAAGATEFMDDIPF